MDKDQKFITKCVINATGKNTTILDDYYIRFRIFLVL